MDRFTAMQTFLTVVDTGSFSNAARRLNVGQPAVSKTIAQLEERLGVKLLVRSTRGLVPTEAGHNFYERARRSVEEAEEADLAARGAGAGLSGKLRIGAAVTFARLHIVPKIPEFLAQILNWQSRSSWTTGTSTWCRRASTSPFACPTPLMVGPHRPPFVSTTLPTSAMRPGRRSPMGDGLIDPLGKTAPGLTKPLIVAVHGDTWNMAHELFLVADVRVAAANTNFGQDENTHGRFPGGGSTVRFTREAGWGNAMRYILTGDHWNAWEAYRMGTVQEVASTPRSALDEAIEIANKIATSGPLGIKASLASAHLAIDPAQANALSALDAQRSTLYRSHDFQEGREAEAEGRQPLYHGN